jgi:hypothetical protein
MVILMVNVMVCPLSKTLFPNANWILISYPGFFFLPNSTCWFDKAEKSPFLRKHFFVTKIRFEVF